MSGPSGSSLDIHKMMMQSEAGKQQMGVAGNASCTFPKEIPGAIGPAGPGVLFNVSYEDQTTVGGAVRPPMELSSEFFKRFVGNIEGCSIFVPVDMSGAFQLPGIGKSFVENKGTGISV